MSETNNESEPHTDVLPPRTDRSFYTKREKWFIVVIVAIGGLFSPLSSNIYFPVIPTLSVAFNKSTELINLTVTAYLILQGFSPMLWGTLSDKLGRRPIFLICLMILSLSCVGLALVPTSDYWLLMLLRCLQATGSASTIALGAGVIGDISTPEERGGFFGVYGLGPLVGPAIGPVIGGLLADKLGWRAIFWFLCIASACCLIFVVLFLPETLRAIVGDGSFIPSAIYRPLWPVIGRRKGTPGPVERPPKRPFVNPLRLFTYPDVLLLLFFNGVVFAAFYGVAASISVLLHEAYPFLSEADLGFCFLAVGGGMLFGSTLTGKFLDRDYARFKRELAEASEMDPEKRTEPEETTRQEEFPIERARLRTIPISLGIFSISCIAYGWCIQKRVSLAGPLILLIAIGFVLIAVMNTTQTLIVDLVPNQSSSVTACNNLVRCSLGAALVSVIDLILDALGTGWTYVLLGGICILLIPVIFLEIRIGPRCRARRRARN